jgi:antitoxin component YwqK of YwqJK toxin-antitoxin module
MMTFASEILVAQPWKIKDEFKVAFTTQEDTNFIYQKVNKGNSCFIEAFSRANNKIKRFDYFVNISDGKKEGAFNFYDKEGKWYGTMLFKNNEPESFLIKLLDSSLAQYNINNTLFNGVHYSYYSNGNIKEYGFYKDNVRIGEWLFYYDNGKVKEKGTYSGKYIKLLYDYNAGNIITLNNYLDTIKVENMNKAKFDSLKRVLHHDFIAYPVQLHYETGVWKFYDINGQLIKEEFYNEGKLIKTVNK